MSNFNNDLAEAQVVEQVFLNILLEKGNIAELNNSSTDLEELRKGDIIIHYQGNKNYIEVKHDRMAPETGNIAVEHATLAYTSSEGICYCIGNIFYLYPTELIIQLINEGHYKKYVYGGDRRSSLLYLFDADYLKSLDGYQYSVN
jgi:hypothetical protein